MTITALILAAATATVAPAATFAGVTLGESATALIAQKGEPADVVDVGPFVKYVYLSSDESGLEDVMLERGNVGAVTVWKPAGWPAPTIVRDGLTATALGATFGGPASTIPPGKQPLTGPDGLLYYIAAPSGTIEMMAAELSQAAEKALPARPSAPIHGGTSTADAVVVIAPNESVGERSEYMYLAFHHCGGGGHWRGGEQALLNEKGIPYDRLEATCSVGFDKRPFFFNIAGYFGKM